MFLRTQKNLNRTYLLLVESYRVQGRIKQRVLFRLGRLDQLRASGVLDRLLGALGRFSEKYAVLGAHAEGQSVSSRARGIGAALIFERLWQDCSIKAVIEALAEKRRFGFELERAALTLMKIDPGLLTFSDPVAVVGKSTAALQRENPDPAQSTCCALPCEAVLRFSAVGARNGWVNFAEHKRVGFHERRGAVFLTVLHRLFALGSDRAAEKWKQGATIAGAEDLELHQLYRTMGWLGEPLTQAPAAGAKALSLRTRCDLIEEQLFERRRDLFSALDLVFFDTTSIYFEGAGGESLGQFGHSKDHRPDLKQMVVGVVLDDEGRPLCSQMWPGNTADVTSLVPVVDRLRTRFKVDAVCIVADRGMISRATIEQIQARGWRYILGVRMRRTREANEEVLARAGRYEEVYAKSADPKAPSPLKVKEVRVEDRRYVVCVNEDQATKDRHDREAIVASLEEALKRGEKQLIGNRGYRKYVKSSGKRFVIDEDKIQAEARFDGKWVLTTNTDLSARELALKYKQLWQVEATFRTMKTALATRPIFHQRDDTIRGHVFCSFLALVLRDELERRLARRGYKFEWADILQDLERLQEIELMVNGKGYRLRTETEGCVGKVFQACGVALPPELQPL